MQETTYKTQAQMQARVKKWEKGLLDLIWGKVAGCCVHGSELLCSIKRGEFRDGLEPDGFSREALRGFRYIASTAGVIHGTAPNSLYPRSSLNIGS